MASLEGEVMHLVYERTYSARQMCRCLEGSADRVTSELDKTMGRKLVPNGISILDEEGIVMIISGSEYVLSASNC